MIGRFLVPLAIVLGIFVYMKGGGTTGANATIAQTCDAAQDTVSVTFDWPPPAITPDETWVDVGLTPAFTAGTFHGNGPIAPPLRTARVEGLPAGVKLYYRINTRVQGAWHAAATGSFTTGCTVTAMHARPTPAVDVINSGP